MNGNWALAWRNLWRHGRRTWLTVGAMVVSNVLLIFSISLQLGSYQVMIENTLATLTGHLQVQQAEYLDSPKMRYSIPDVVPLAKKLRQELDVKTVAARSETFALASSDDRSFGIQVMGVEPEFEPLVSTLPGLVKEGRWFSANDAEEIILGKVLAGNLKVGLGDEVTFLGSGRDGSFAAAVATVVGIMESGFVQADRSVAQLPLGYFDTVFSMQGHGHRIVINGPGLDLVPQLVAAARAQVKGLPDIVVHDWDALQPGLNKAIKADFSSAWFIYGILVILVAFSVLNTQLMSVLERTREFGTMLALGIRPGRLGVLVAQETLLMSTIGLSIGVLLGLLLSLYLGEVGFTVDGMEEANQRFNMPERMYPEVCLLTMLWGPLVVFAGAMLASIYPARRLLKLDPVIAMKAI